MYIAGVASFLVGSCGDRVRWHDSSSERACGVEFTETDDDFGALRVSLTEILSKFSSLILSFPFEMKVAFGGVDSVSQPPRQPDHSNEQTGTSNALAFPGGQEADKFDGGGGSKSSGSLDIRFRVEKVQAPLCDWKTATLEYSL
ncbi:hypothetical protein Bca4012_089203 [Brassica carinata]